ncbi:MAG: hypothetical protein WCD08_13275 [Steroidobacteraceae bacterium]
MNGFRLVCILVGALAASSGFALSPPLDSSPAFFSGDWVGMGANDNFCFMRLRPDGLGTVLISSPSGDWVGARIRWHNQRQSMVVSEVNPLPGDPHRRLLPLSQLTLRVVFGGTFQLVLNTDIPTCELQRRTSVQRRMEEAELLLNSPAEARKANDRK